MNDDRPLPYGWIKEWDNNSNHFFYVCDLPQLFMRSTPDVYLCQVDAQAEPPRSIWVHPYEDEQYLREHPDIREKMGPSRSTDGLHDRPSNSALSRRASFPSDSPTPSGSANTRQEMRDHPDKRKERGFFAKLKDKAIGTKEEREAARIEERRREEENRRRMLQLRQERFAYAQQRYPQSFGGGFPPYQGQGQYMPPQYGPPSRSGFGSGFGRTGGGMGGMGMGMPILGGLAGGLLLGQALDGFGGDGGDFGGGDFGGGDFGGDGGGDFGGGGDF